MKTLKIMRIVARLNIGGPAVHVIQLSAGLDPAEFQSTVVVGKTHAFEGDMSYLAQRHAVETIVVDSLTPKISPWKDLLSTWHLYRLMRKHRPDIVETHTAKAGTVGRVAAILARVPNIVHVFHGHVFHSYFGRAKTQFFIAIERLLARFSDRIITISPLQRDEIVDRYQITRREKVEVIRLGFDLQPFGRVAEQPIGELRERWGIAPQARLVGFVGRLTGVKRPEIVIEAAKKVCERLEDVQFVLVGDGELKDALVHQRDDAGLGEKVHFVGWHEKMDQVYSALDLVILCSANEGTPITLIEALACRCPVVATDVGGVADIVIDQKTGRLVSAEDHDGFAEAIVECLENSEHAKAMATRGQQRVSELWSINRLIEESAAFYRSLV